MKVFFSDLDNTLIYSHRHPIGNNKILVELLNGKEQSYMTERTYSYLRDAEWLTLIPVTTRSQEQYMRLMFPEDFRIEYALICNGGKLLIHGVESQDWSIETINTIQTDIPDLERLGEKLQSLSDKEIRKPENYYFYAKVNEPEKICDMLIREAANTNICVEHDHSKVYLFPKSLNKGEAIRRFIKKYQVSASVGAGDSMIDFPMLYEVNYPLAAANLCSETQIPNVKALPDRIISDQICQELERLHAIGAI